MDLVMCDFALCDILMKTNENRPLMMMQKMVVLSSFSYSFLQNNVASEFTSLLENVTSPA